MVKPPRFLSAAAILLALMASPRFAAGQDNPYTAVYSDGERITGALTSWGQYQGPDRHPKIKGDLLFKTTKPPNPIRWLKQETAEQPIAPAAFVEMVGGDLLPGRVIGAGEAATLQDGMVGAHLVVEPSAAVNLPDSPRATVRVLTRWLRRIVWQRRSSDQYQPGTLFYKDGRQVGFRKIRFGERSASVLTDSDDRREVHFSELAEIDMPRQDWWNAYFEQVAALTPDCSLRLMQVETFDGLRATTSQDRFLPLFWGNPNLPAYWVHAVQPAWALDGLFLPHTRILMRRFFGPHEVPLSLVEPNATRLKSALAVGWSPRVDRNVQGGPLVNGGKEFGWGLGMQAYTEMDFPLPLCVESFESRVGLDRVIGDGGCARALVYADKAEGAPLFRSNHLIGSAKSEATGTLPLDPAGNRQAQLVLVAHPAAADKPAGADPLDIRDVLDWLEPQVNLDLSKLRGEVARRALALVPGLEGWTVAPADASRMVFANRWDQSDPHDRRFFYEFRPEGAALTLSRTLKVGAEQNWLLLYIDRNPDGGSTTPTQAVIRIGDKEVGNFDVPARSGAGKPPPLKVSLERYHGQQVPLEVRLVSRGDKSFVDWRSMELVQRDPTLFDVFEDEVRSPVRLSSPTGRAEVDTTDRYSGKACLKVMGSGGRGVLADLDLAIRETPAFGEYHYLQFAWRKSGGRQIALELNYTPGFESKAGGAPSRLRYVAGPNHVVPEEVRGKALGDQIPDSWVLSEPIDLYKDIGAAQLNSISLLCPDGEEADFDRIYLGRTPQDFDRCPPRVAR